MTDILHGETVTITSWYCVQRGYYTEYDARFQFDNPDGGAPITRRIKFNESVAKTMRQAGYADVKYSTSSMTHDAHISVILDGSGDKLKISHVYGTDETTTFEVVQERRKHTDAKKQMTTEERSAFFGDPATKARLAKKEAQQTEPTPITQTITADSAIFDLGAELNRDTIARMKAEREAAKVYTLRLGHWLRGVA